jgi:mitochondrial distribution and morphology protein 12
MSIDLNWETITSGPDGEVLRHRIRDFVHAKFQAVKLPRFIKSVTVHDFEFGSIAPQLELKDITDPLPDFYEDNEDYEDDDDTDDGLDLADDVRSTGGAGTPVKSSRRQQELERELAAASAIPSRLQTGSPMRGGQGLAGPGDTGSPFLGVSTPGLLGGASNLHYFQSHLGSGWSGTQTPLAAVAGAHMGNSGWLEHSSGTTSPFYHQPSPFMREGMPRGGSPSHSRNPSQESISFNEGNSPLAALTPNHAQHQHGQGLREKSSVSTLAPTSVNTSRPPTRDPSSLAAAAAASGTAIEEEDDLLDGPDAGRDDESPGFRDARPEDIQAVFRIRYAGDIKLRLTAEILLDYPMPSFVGIPVQLSVTGMSFDGIGVTAHIRKRVHFCFLSPEDALTAVGLPPEDEEEAQNGEGGGKKRFGGLLQEIQVESEIGLREGGKQSLKNVGKVERFVLEQVRRIFEDEFVYPSFWTFLV